ncbi:MULTISPECIES: beta-ketoacyl-ACP reductase [Halorussus]|uniref:beta-ketoacyl-ACP reductase n=1 Tax=Halorussus TaxID=1070314 RepID=UPI00209F4DCC|nr:beta-ketoacyl-ACP reductase [Halorussus vallis]USZ74261.1 beta-ketoacyl-ACP reductase [Halorussus vallis]
MTARTCVITGASRGIGAAVATALGRTGANVVVNYRSSEGDAYDVVDDVESAGGTAMPVQADVTDADAVGAMAEQVRDAFGPADVLVNNAGITEDRVFKNMDREAWNRVLDVNLGGTFNCTKAFYDDIESADEGRLVNVSSVVGEEGNYGQANYAASKSGLFGFTRTLAQEFAASGTTANCVAPGFTETDMLAEVDETIQDQIREDIPLDRFATVEDVAGAVQFLASADSSYVTGQVLGVNGGMAF